MGILNKLNVKRTRSLPKGRYNDGGGLWLFKQSKSAGQWIFRYSINGTRREMGLGGINWVSLSEARAEADKWRRLSKRGVDPIGVRNRTTTPVSDALQEVAKSAFEARKKDLKDGGKAGRWFSPLERHVLPKLGGLSVADLSQNVIRETLDPIWQEKPETARKAMNRLGIVIRHAAAMGHDVDLQAVDKARELLGSNKSTVRHMPAIAWSDLPTFYATLDDNSVAVCALRFLILTAARTSEVRFAHIDEIQGDLWTVPSARMKAGHEHRVPLTSDALLAIEAAKPWSRDGFLFTGPRGKPLSDMAMSTYMKRRQVGAVPHGFRSSFRTWCAEATDIPREIAETALAHVVGNNVERSYRRTDYLDQRRALMDAWAQHVTGG